MSLELLYLLLVYLYLNLLLGCIVMSHLLKRDIDRHLISFVAVIQLTFKNIYAHPFFLS